MKNLGAMLKQCLQILAVLYFCEISEATAQSDSTNEEVYVSSLSIKGLKRTRLSTAERALKKFIGIKADEIDTDDVIAAVLATGILEPVSVEVVGSVLRVTVKEKWSIIPVPVFFTGAGETMGGVAFYDANAFGLNDKFLVAGLIRTGGWVATVGYTHASPGERIPGWNLMTTFSREDRYDRDQNKKTLRHFANDSLAISAAINFPLLKDSNLLVASALFSLNQKNLREKSKAYNGPEEDLRIFGSGLELAVDRSSWDGFFLCQESASIRYTYKTSFGEHSYHSVRFRSTYGKSIVPGFRFNMNTGLAYEPGVPVLFESPPSAAQVAILPRRFTARHLAGGSAGLEKYIFKFAFGTISATTAYHLAYSNGSILGDSVDHGPVAMLVFYLNKIAIPAVGLGTAYNVAADHFQFSFSVGMSF